MKFDRQAAMRPLFVESVQPKPDEIWFSVESSIDDLIICRWIGIDIAYTLKMDFSSHSRLSLKQTAKLIITLVEQSKTIQIAVDTIGVGAGVYQYLLDKGYRVAAISPARHCQPSKTPHTIG